MLSIREFKALGLTGMYQCRACGEIKPIEEFVKNPSRKSGHESKCKICHAKKSKERRNDPVVNERYREYSRKNNNRLRSEARRIQANGRFGVIYIFRCERFYKIGRSNDPERRLKSISRSLPFKIELIHTIESDHVIWAELQLHGRFSDKRSTGEWFELTAADVQWLLSTTAINYEKENGA